MWVKPLYFVRKYICSSYGIYIKQQIVQLTQSQEKRWGMVITPCSLSTYTALFLLLFLFFRHSGQGWVLKGSVMCLQQLKNPSLKFSLLYSLWHKQTSTYALPHIDVPDILKCLTDTLSLPQILSEGMASRLCQFPILCQDTETWNIFGLKG